MTPFWDSRIGAYIVQVLPGELHVTNEDVVITTVLGSCVSACVRDPRHHVGGINHFMLPDTLRGDAGDSARYGVYALERLVNQVLGKRGKRADLEVKVFGGGRVIDAGGDVGKSNIELVRRFFAAEQIAILSEDLGKRYARRVRYWPRTGRAQVQRIPMARATEVVANEQRVAHEIEAVPGSVELF
jgi:chemotaxis protein CheD